MATKINIPKRIVCMGCIIKRLFRPSRKKRTTGGPVRVAMVEKRMIFFCFR